MISPARRLSAVPDPPAPAPIPPAPGRGARRPGERHEPVRLRPEALARLESAAGEARLSSSLAATVALEAALVLEELHLLGVDDPCTLLDRAAGEARVMRRLSAAEADYARALRQSQPANALPTVSLRVLSRLGDRRVEDVLDPALVTLAARWELAALLTGRTMAEWALAAALAAR